MDVFALPIGQESHQLSLPTIQPLPSQFAAKSIRILTDEERLQPRDMAVFQAIHEHNGVLTDAQVQQLIPFGAKAFERRILWLTQAGFLDRRKALTGEMVNFLKPRGAMKVASMLGAGTSQFKWRRPGERWLEVPHDVASNEYAIALERSVAALAGVTIMERLSDYELRRFPDKVILKGPKGGTFHYSVYPDWFHQLIATHPTTGRQIRLRYLEETDMGEHSGIAFVERKVIPYATYFDSPAYHKRYGANHGQCLVMTTDEKRLMLLKERTEHSGISTVGRFYFTTLEAVKTSNILTAPIWRQAGRAEWVCLLNADSKVS
jgi:hypothetical protein